MISRLIENIPKFEGKKFSAPKSDVDVGNGKTHLMLAIESKDKDRARQLIERGGANIDHRDWTGSTALHYTVKCGYYGLTKLLLEDGAEVDCRDLQHRTPLMYGSYLNHADIVEMLIDHGADVHAQDFQGRTALFMKDWRLGADVVDLLVSAKARANHVSKRFETPLLLAVEDNALLIVEKFVKGGVDVNCTDCFGTTALIKASCHGHLNIVRYLISHDVQADPDITNDLGNTALMLACENEHVEISRCLVDYGADNSPVNANGRTVYDVVESKRGSGVYQEMVAIIDKSRSGNNLSASLKRSSKENDLLVACKDSSNQAINSLIAEGVYVHRRDRNFMMTPLANCVVRGNREGVILLLSAGADVNARFNKFTGTTPLMRAVEDRNVGMMKTLLAAGADVNMSTEHGDTALLKAVEKDDDRVVDLLLTQDVDVNAQNNRGTSALMRAAEYRSLSAIKTLLSKGADINSRDNRGRTALDISLERNHLPTKKCLLNATISQSLELRESILSMAKHLYDSGISRGEPPTDISDIDNKTLIKIAILLGHQELVGMLLKTETQFNLSDEDCLSSLMIAVLTGQKNLVDILINAGAHVDIKDKENRTPLMGAAHKGNDVILTSLLDKKSDVCRADAKGWSALMYCTQHGFKQCMETLINYGADLEAKTDSGDTAFSIAAANGHEKSVEYLLGKGANINCQNSVGYTPIMLASFHGHTDIVKSLTSHRPSLTCKDFSDGNTALHIACERGMTDIAVILVNQSIDLNAKNSKYETALHISASRGHTDIVEHLLHMGAQVDVSDREGNSALFLSELNNHHDVCQLLEKAGALTGQRKEQIETALFLSAEAGCKHGVVALLKTGQYGKNEVEEAMRAAVRCKQDGVVALLSDTLAQERLQLPKDSSTPSNSHTQREVRSDGEIMIRENNFDAEENRGDIEHALDRAFHTGHGLDRTLIQEYVRTMDLTSAARTSDKQSRTVVYNNIKISADHIGLLSTATGGIVSSQEDTENQDC